MQQIMTPIVQCHNLVGINVVNSSLAMLHVLEALDRLRDLRYLSFTILDVCEFSARRLSKKLRSRKFYPLNTIYLEVSPKQVDVDFAFGLPER